MNDFRCSQCKKLLAKIQPMISKDGTNYLTFHENGKVKDIIPKIEIICPRCKTMNTGEVEINVVDPVPFESKYDCITVVRMTKEDVLHKYGVQIK